MAKAKLKITSKPIIAPKKPGGPLRLDLGSGARRPEPVSQWGDDWVGIDISSDCGADVALDLRKNPWPIEDGAVDEIYTSHFLEHLGGLMYDARVTPLVEFLIRKHPEDREELSKYLAAPTPERISFMEECWRVLKDGAQMTVVIPYWSSMRSVQDPFHLWQPICEMSFLYFNKSWMQQNKLEHYGIKADFDFSYGYVLHPDLQVRNQEYQMACVRDHVNAVSDLSVTLTKRPAS